MKAFSVNRSRRGGYHHGSDFEQSVYNTCHPSVQRWDMAMTLLALPAVHQLHAATCSTLGLYCSGSFIRDCYIISDVRKLCASTRIFPLCGSSIIRQVYKLTTSSSGGTPVLLMIIYVLATSRSSYTAFITFSRHYTCTKKNTSNVLS